MAKSDPKPADAETITPAAKAESVSGAANMIEVTIKSDGHTHGGKQCKPGDKITLHSRKVDGLIKRGVIHDPAAQAG